MSDVFDDMAGEKSTQSYSFFDNAGRYRVQVLGNRYKKGFKGRSLIAELKVVKAEASSVGVKPHEPGYTGSYVEKLNDDPKKSGGGRFKNYLMQLSGDTKAEMAPEVMRYLMNDAPKTAEGTEQIVQPTVGLYVDLEVWGKKLAAKEGKPEKTISAFKWSTVKQEEQPSLEQINAFRRERGLLPIEPPKAQ